MGQPSSNTTLGNHANPNSSQLIGDLNSNSHAISSPAPLPIGGITGTHIPGDVPFNAFGAVTSGLPTSAIGQVSTNSTHDTSAATTSQTSATTWSKFAQQSGQSQAIETNPKALDSFQQFKKQAKDKQEKDRLIEMQEQRRREREQQEREQQERERLTQQDQEGEMALNSLARAEQSPVLSPASDSQSPASGASTSRGGSSMLNLREQERRRREALASQNQMDLSRQSEIMSKFEDRV